MIAPLGYALIASAALNLLAGWAWLGQRDTIATLRTEVKAVQGQLDGARADARACSDAVDDLRTLADHRAEEASAARAAAQQRAQTHNRRADAILAAPLAVPGDDCASARVRVDQWIKGRTAQ
ncbi:hypothetical protein C6568_12395 [Melaminivora suipulveris]|uniref:Uncharacterized protein n=1 Tax=Melaminivora suipulveris TaxID=2109913 RepID=A0A2R3QDW7_9BURK|nr:hypothetical protein [Melaminivora suipulveris]AVO49960.1 hypothetical protein C6568_12395 [Melaminivora suipulveris]